MTINNFGEFLYIVAHENPRTIAGFIVFDRAMTELMVDQSHVLFARLAVPSPVGHDNDKVYPRVVLEKPRGLFCLAGDRFARAAHGLGSDPIGNLGLEQMVVMLPN